MLRALSVKSVVMMTALSIILLLLLLDSNLAVEAKKSKSLPKPYRNLLPHITCDTCERMIHNADLLAKTMRTNQSRQGLLKEEDFIEEVVEVVCNPFTAGGAWLRQADWRIVDNKQLMIQYHLTEEEDEEQNSLPPIPGLEEELKKAKEGQLTVGYGKCQRACSTVTEACNAVLESDDADELSAYLFKGKKSKAKMRSLVCETTCAKFRELKRKKKLPKMESEWTSEKFQTVTHKEKEIEEMMDRMQQTNQGHDVYSREEMEEMREAMRSGDRERMEEFDPSAAELSDEEFASLRRMQAEQQAGAEAGAGAGEDDEE